MLINDVIIIHSGMTCYAITKLDKIANCNFFSINCIYLFKTIEAKLINKRIKIIIYKKKIYMTILLIFYHKTNH